ncbi:MAG TPA: hypothetical protein VJG29_01215 [Candidatus Paceibacterota bacterium]
MINGRTLFVRVEEDADGKPCAIALGIDRVGETFQGLLTGYADAISLALQYGAPLDDVVNEFAFTRFGPIEGFVEGHESIKMCTSILDFVARHLGIVYLNRHDLALSPEGRKEEQRHPALAPVSRPTLAVDNDDKK